MRSDCSLFVGMPVDGPPRCTLKITDGISAIDDRPNISDISDSPGPDVAVIAFAPANDAPTTAPIAASSSSVCSDVPPIFGSHSPRRWRTSDEGVIGYPAKNVQPACIAPTAAASLPDMSRCGFESAKPGHPV